MRSAQRPRWLDGPWRPAVPHVEPQRESEGLWEAVIGVVVGVLFALWLTRAYT